MTDEQLIESLDSDKNIIMTEQLHRIFNAGGCNPCCHSCDTLIAVGSLFKLGTIDKIKYKATDFLLKDIQEDYDNADKKWKDYCNKSYGNSFKYYDHEATRKYKNKDGYGHTTYIKKFILERKTENLKILISNIYNLRYVEKKKEDEYSFKVESKEVMLCDICSAEDYKKKEIDKVKEKMIETLSTSTEELNKIIHEINNPPSRGCFRINGKISLNKN